jgi:hypothetical protein
MAGPNKPLSGGKQDRKSWYIHTYIEAVCVEKGERKRKDENERQITPTFNLSRGPLCLIIPACSFHI